MHLRVAGLALLSVIGIGVAVTSCGTAPATVKPLASALGSVSGAAVSSGPASASPAASGVASSSAGSVPAGYTRIGGAAQGISIAAPASWTAVDLAKLSASAAASKITIGGASTATLIQDMQTLQKLHAVAVWDIKSAADTPQHFTRNLNAYCFQGAGIDVGAAGVPSLKAAVTNVLGSERATHVTQQDLTIGGVPGVETSYQLTSSVSGTFYGSQLAVVPKADDTCVATESWGAGQSAGNVLNVAAASAEFP